MPEASLRAQIIARNALRRAAKLPLLDEDAEVRRGLGDERRQSRRNDLDQHEPLLRELRLQAAVEFEKRNGKPAATVLGWWGINALAQRRFEVEVERRFGVVLAKR